MALSADLRNPNTAVSANPADVDAWIASLGGTRARVRKSSGDWTPVMRTRLHVAKLKRAHGDGSVHAESCLWLSAGYLDRGPQPKECLNSYTPKESWHATLTRSGGVGTRRQDAAI